MSTVLCPKDQASVKHRSVMNIAEIMDMLGRPNIAVSFILMFFLKPWQILATYTAGAMSEYKQTPVNSLEVMFLLLLGFFAIFLLVKRNSKLLPPGPKGFPFLGNSLQLGHSFNQLLLRDLAKAYGDIICLKVGLHSVVTVSSPELAREVLQKAEFAFRTRSIVAGVFTGDGKDVVFGDDGEHWRILRRILSTPFTNRGLHRYWSAFEEEVDRAVVDIGIQSKETANGVLVYPRLQLMMYSVVYYMLFGWRFQTEQDALFMKLRALNEDRKSLVMRLDQKYGDFVPGYLKPFIWRDVKKCKEIKDRSLSQYKDLVEEYSKRIRAEGHRKGREKFAIDSILEAEKQGEISEEEMLYMLVNINIAAIDTTLVPLDWIVAELANNHHIQQKLREELRSVLGIGVPVSESSLPSLPYLRAVVKETLRLHTPVPLLLPHMNLRPAQLGGYQIPARSKILVNSWWLANNPQHWDNPQEFRPERFMDEKLEFTGNDFRFVPFGSGRRSCPGSSLAYNMICLFAGRLVQEYEVHPPPGRKKIDLSPICTELFHGLAKHPCITLKPVQK